MSIRNSIPRSALRDGINICGVLTSWEDSWHEFENWAIASEPYTCDECDGRILPGELYSQGSRQAFPDAPFPVYGIDRIHFKCTYEGKQGKTPEEIIKDHPELNKEPCFDGVVAILTGDMSVSKLTLRGDIEANGGIVKDNITRQTTHMIVGRPGRTEFGQITGPGSKKYKEGKKKKLIEVDEAWVNARLECWKRTGVPALKQAEGEEESKSEDVQQKSNVQREAFAREIKKSEDEEQEKEQDVRKEEKEKEEGRQEENVSEEAKDKEKQEKKRKREDEEQEEVPAKKQKTSTKEQSEVTPLDGFDAMKRKQLQSLAKKHGIPANLKNEELKERLRKVSQN